MDRIREIGLNEIMRLKALINAGEDELDIDVCEIVEDMVDGEDPEFPFNLDSKEGQLLYAALEHAAELLEDYNKAIHAAYRALHDYNNSGAGFLQKRLEMIQNYGIEIACPELVEDIDN